MGFAIPIENAIKKAEQIIKGETANYPYIGISMLDLSKAYYSYQYYDLIKESNLSSGVIVVDVEKGSPASKAGLKSNDIITNINGEEVKNVAYLRYYLYQNNINDEIKLTIFRDGKKQDITVKLGTNKQTT